MPLKKTNEDEEEQNCIQETNFKKEMTTAQTTTNQGGEQLNGIY